MSPPKFEIFLIFPYFVRFQALSRSATREAARFPSCYTRYHASFYLWLIRYVSKYCKVPKYYDQDCLKIFSLLSTLPAMIWISGKKMLIWLKKVSSLKKLPICDDESFLGSILVLNWTCKILLTQNCEIWNFNTIDLLYIFLKDWRNALITYKMSKN